MLFRSEMKKIGLSSTNILALDEEFRTATSSIDVDAIFSDIKSKISSAIYNKEYEKILLYYDNKGLLSEAARQFGYKQKGLEEFVGRILRSDASSELHSALKAHLPTVVPRLLQACCLGRAYAFTPELT